MQALYLMVLEPVTETKADANSHGFRSKRRTADAIDALYRLLSNRFSPEWILERDIKGCFDHISHEWLLGNVQTDKVILKKWLEAGVVFNKILSPTKEGTPQGGIISPTPANATLDGMEKLVCQKYKKKYLDKGKWDVPKINLIRYADDFVVTAANRGTFQDIQLLLTDFLAQRGLTLSEEKMLITNISEGFDLLGFNIRKYNGKLLIKLSKKSQKKFTDKTHEVIFNHKAVAQHVLIGMINPVITGWASYFRHVVSKDVFSSLDHVMILELKRWAFRKHSNKSRKWVSDKYFKARGTRKWCFSQIIKDKESKTRQTFTLKKLSDTPIERYVKIKKQANPFDEKWDAYFEQRQRKCRRVRSSLNGNTGQGNIFIGQYVI